MTDIERRPTGLRRKHKTAPANSVRNGRVLRTASGPRARRRPGQALSEYAIIVAIIAVISLIGLAVVSGSTAGVFSSISSSVGDLAAGGAQASATPAPTASPPPTAILSSDFASDGSAATATVGPGSYVIISFTAPNPMPAGPWMGQIAMNGYVDVLPGSGATITYTADGVPFGAPLVVGPGTKVGLDNIEFDSSTTPLADGALIEASLSVSGTSVSYLASGAQFRVESSPNATLAHGNASAPGSAGAATSASDVTLFSYTVPAIANPWDATATVRGQFTFIPAGTTASVHYKVNGVDVITTGPQAGPVQWLVGAQSFASGGIGAAISSGDTFSIVLSVSGPGTVQYSMQDSEFNVWNAHF